MLSRGNTKLGEGIFAWNLPVVKTCPGASALCLALCYAQKGHFLIPNVKEIHWDHLELAENKRFVNWMVDEIRHKMVQVLRLHSSGDFYSAEYIRKWREIARRSPRTMIYAYTRSWAVDELQPQLRLLAEIPNVQLWLSADRTMLQPPAWANCKTCYLSQDDADQPKYPVNLVFRDKRKTVLKRTTNGSQICPYDNGVKTQSRITCSKCRICFPQSALVQLTSRV